MEAIARDGPMTRGEGGWPDHEARERRRYLEDQRDSQQRLRDAATTAPLEFNDDEKLTCRDGHEIISYCQPTDRVRSFSCDSYPKFLFVDGEMIKTPRPPVGMLMLGCRTCDEDFCTECVLEMPLLAMLDPLDELLLPQTEKKKKKEKDAKNTNPLLRPSPSHSQLSQSHHPQLWTPRERHRPRQRPSLSSEHARRPESAQPSQLPPAAQ